MTRPSYSLSLTRQAREDIIDIGDHIAYTLLSPGTALSFVEGLEGAIATLKNMPRRYALVDDEVLAAQGVRCMPYKDHYVFYRVSDTDVAILRVGYKRRNWKSLLHDSELTH